MDNEGVLADRSVPHIKRERERDERIPGRDFTSFFFPQRLLFMNSTTRKRHLVQDDIGSADLSAMLDDEENVRRALFVQFQKKKGDSDVVGPRVEPWNASGGVVEFSGRALATPRREDCVPRAPSGDPNYFPTRKFRYLVRDPPGNKKTKKKEDSSDPPRRQCDVLELSFEYSIEKYPNRIVVARNVPTAAGLKAASGGKPPDTVYDFFIYPNFRRLVCELMTQSPSERTMFAMAEENGAIFVYFDMEMDVKYHDSERHGCDMRALVGYCLAMIRHLLSSIVGVNLAAWGDSYLLLDSSTPVKWSGHVHVGWPFRSVTALGEAMGEVKECLWDMFDRGVKAVRPMFYLAGTEWKSFVDLAVYTPRRNFRLPFCTKWGRKAWLMPVKDGIGHWNRPVSEGGIDVAKEDVLVSAGMLLVRNSMAFWSRTCVKFGPLLQPGSAPPRPSDFRCVPLSGSSRDLTSRMKEILVAPWPTSPSRLVMEVMVRFFRTNYDVDFAAVASKCERVVDCPVGRMLDACRRGPRFLVGICIFLAQRFVPGTDLADASASSSLDEVRSAVEEVEEFVDQGNPARAFASVMWFHAEVEAVLSRTCGPEGAVRRRSFLAAVARHFCSTFIVPKMSPSSYNSRAVVDPFVMSRMARALVVLSGSCIHAFETPDLASFLPEHPDLGALSGLYPYVFAASMDRECVARSKALKELYPPREGDIRDLMMRVGSMCSDFGE